MKLIICNKACLFQVEGADFESVVSLLRLPEWVIESYDAWKQNGWSADLTLHVTKELIILVEYSAHGLPAPPDRANVEEIKKELRARPAKLKDLPRRRPAEAAKPSPVKKAPAKKRARRNA